MSSPTTSNRRSCPTCAHSWLDKYNKDECPKCNSRLSTGGAAVRRAPGEACTNKLSPSDACESSGGVCSKGGPHTFRFGKCSKCQVGEGATKSAPRTGSCPKHPAGKHIFKFGTCPCGAREF